jgi:hypothetical protein
MEQTALAKEISHVDEFDVEPVQIAAAALS